MSGLIVYLLCVFMLWSKEEHKATILKTLPTMGFHSEFSHGLFRLLVVAVWPITALSDIYKYINGAGIFKSKSGS